MAALDVAHGTDDFPLLLENFLQVPYGSLWSPYAILIYIAMAF
jgi:hypothetical protein